MSCSRAAVPQHSRGNLLNSFAYVKHPYTVWPPSTTMAWPMTKLAASEHNHTTVAAISSGLPILPTGSCAITACRPSAVPPLKRSIIGVSMIPGHTALMRMFDGA